MQYAQLRGIPGVTMNDIYTGNGVSELINLCMQALLDNGDEILIPAPDYPLWTATATLAGGNVVHYICDEQSEWYPDIDDIRSKITDKTKAIVIINPNNPTGAVYPKEILEQIVQIAREHELIIFSDEIYDRLIMDGYSILHRLFGTGCILRYLFRTFQVPHDRRLPYRMDDPGAVPRTRRKGYIEGINMLSSMRLCSNVPAQSIVQTALAATRV